MTLVLSKSGCGTIQEHPWTLLPGDLVSLTMMPGMIIDHTLPPSIYQGDYLRYKDCGILAKSDHGHVLDHWEWHEAPCSYNWGYVCEK